jgi:hypothetical protein
MTIKSIISQTLLVALGLYAAFSAFSCRKGPDIAPPDFDFHANQMQAQQAIGVLQDLIYEATQLSTDVYDGDNKITIGQCPQIVLEKVDSVNKYPARLTIDASGGCLWRGHQVSGTIVLLLDKSINSGNAKLEGNVNTFAIDQSTLNGTALLQLGTAEKPFANMNFELTDFSAANTDGNTIMFNTLSAARIQTEGQLTVVATGGKPALDDDVYTIVISGNGEANDSVNFDIETETPVTRSMNCRWIAKGKIVVNAGPGDGYLDFGDGTCDNQAILKVGNDQKTITLR